MIINASHPSNIPFGIQTLGLAFPTTAVEMTELARLRGVEVDKYHAGIGCQAMAVCADGTTVVDLAVQAAERALARWKRPLQDIGLLAVGTECGLDYSRPISAWIAQKLGLSGAVRSYEVKHACLGATLALRQALEWKHTQNSVYTDHSKAALVIATDVALYEPKTPGEATQGAGAVAMIVDHNPAASIDLKSYSWSQPVFDFWRPHQQAYPQVDGALSLRCYIEAARQCFGALIGTNDSKDVISQYDVLCFHVPFPKITLKTLRALGQGWKWSPHCIQDIYDTKIDPYLHFNKLIGNSYTASLWVSVAHGLSQLKTGQKLLAFSYGSGCGAELLSLQKTNDDDAWLNDLTQSIQDRRLLSAEQYDAYSQSVDPFNPISSL